MILYHTVALNIHIYTSFQELALLPSLEGSHCAASFIFLYFYFYSLKFVRSASKVTDCGTGWLYQVWFLVGAGTFLFAITSWAAVMPSHHPVLGHPLPSSAGGFMGPGLWTPQAYNTAAGCTAITVAQPSAVAQVPSNDLYQSLESTELHLYAPVPLKGMLFKHRWNLYQDLC
jgi:hypothetical protein